MNKLLTSTLTFFFLIVSSVSLAGQTWLIKQVTIVDSEHLNTYPEQDVLIQNSKITAIGKNLTSNTATLINGKGQFLIPGLIDSHVHLGTNGGLREDKLAEQKHLLDAFRKQEPKSYLYFGFTTLVDLNQSESFANSWQELEAKPDLIYCKSAPFTNGYGMAFVPKAHKFNTPYFLYDINQQEKIPDNINPQEHTPNAVVKKIAKTGARCIKTFHESGFGGLWDWPTPDNSTIRNISHLAASQGLVHFHHGNSLESHRQAAQTDIHVMAHGLWHWQEFNSATTLPTDIEQTLARLISQKTAYQPTAQVLGGELAIFDSAFLYDKSIAHSLPPQLLKWHQNGNSRWFNKRMESMIKNNPKIVRNFLGRKPTGKVGETSKAGLQRLGQVLQYLEKNGGRILLASDTPSGPTYANPPGYNGLLEINMLHDLGLSLETIFQAATINNAKALRIDQDVGSIEVGKKANMLLLKSNPLKNIDAYNQVVRIFVGGKSFLRQTLSAQQPL